MMHLTLALLLQALLASLAFAAPITTASHGNAWKFGTGGGIVGFIVLVLDVIVFIEIFKSNRPPLSKLLWVLGVFFFPVIGLIVYWLFSNRSEHMSGGGGYQEIA